MSIHKQLSNIENVDNPHRFMTMVYVVSLSVIAILSTAAHFVLDSVIESQSSTGVLVNKSGQQRMLSQRASLFTLEFINDGRLEAKTTADQALKKMLENHAYLLEEHNVSINTDKPSPLSSTMHQMYFSPPLDVDRKIRVFANSIERALASPEEYRDKNALSDIPFLVMAKGDFLLSLDTIVKQYETESIDKIQKLRFAQHVVLAIVILTIVAEAYFVFRPMVAKMSIFAQKLQYDANYDHLSGLYNRRAFYLVADKLFSAAKRQNEDMSIILFDIDRFKRINDTFGHDAGDKAIKLTSKIILQSIRKSDVAARYGGEEFLLLLPNTDAQNAILLAEKIRIDVMKTRLSYHDDDIDMTISAGVSQCQSSDDTIQSAITRADKSLLEAKSSGRNCTQIFSALIEQIST